MDRHGARIRNCNADRRYTRPRLEGADNIFPCPDVMACRSRILHVDVVRHRLSAKEEIKYDIKSSACRQSLVSSSAFLPRSPGSIWAKFNWGSFWNWDPRETSIFVLLLIYGAYFSLRSAVEVEERRASLSAVYSIVAFVTVPFFVFIMPRIMFSLHPGGGGSAAPIVNSNGKMYLDMNMRYVFYGSLIGFSVSVCLAISIENKNQFVSLQ